MGGVYETSWDRYIRDIYEILIPFVFQGQVRIVLISLAEELLPSAHSSIDFTIDGKTIVVTFG
jgi:hypothetical protein